MLYIISLKVFMIHINRMEYESVGQSDIRLVNFVGIIHV